ncbi:MAG: hypothetical protein MUP58_03600 [Candidatus Nanohaloarchaeota archaeon QJJ-9]|nr:hypothetical protein [Candidatus Nanohaloarchaeota archaeon QJJ-9]
MIAMKSNFYKENRKGQSAIEYLTTYGWALLAIVIVGAVLMQMGVFSQCQQVTPKFSGQQASVATFSPTGTNSLQFEVQAINKDLTDVGVAVDVDDDGNYDYNNSGAVSSIAAGDSAVVTLDTGSEFSSGECASATLALNYTVEELTDNTITTGSAQLTWPVP